MSWSQMGLSTIKSSFGGAIGDGFGDVPIYDDDVTAEPTASPFSPPSPPSPPSEQPISYEPVDYAVAGAFLFTITCLLLSIIFMALCLVAVRRRSLVVYEDENSLDPATGFHHQRLYIRLDLRCDLGSLHFPLACFGRLLPRRAFPDDFEGFPESHTLTPNERRESLAVLLRKMSRQILDGGEMSERPDCTDSTTAKERSEIPESATSMDLEECFVKDDHDAVASSCSVEVFAISSKSLSFDGEQQQQQKQADCQREFSENGVEKLCTVESGEGLEMADVASGDSSESADVVTKLSPLEETKVFSEDKFCHDRHLIQLAKTEEMSDSCTHGGKSTVVSSSAAVWTRSDVNDQAETDEDRFCSICLEEYEVGDVCVVSDSCPHRFHRDCILEWLMRRNATTSCPCCRKDLVSNEDIERVSNELAVGGNGEGAAGTEAGAHDAFRTEGRGRRRRVLEVLLFPRTAAVVVQRSFSLRRSTSSRRRRGIIAPAENDRNNNMNNSDRGFNNSDRSFNNSNRGNSINSSGEERRVVSTDGADSKPETADTLPEPVGLSQTRIMMMATTTPIEEEAHSTVGASSSGNGTDEEEQPSVSHSRSMMVATTTNTTIEEEPHGAVGATLSGSGTDEEEQPSTSQPRSMMVATTTTVTVEEEPNGAVAVGASLSSNSTDEEEQRSMSQHRSMMVATTTTVTIEEEPHGAGAAGASLSGNSTDEEEPPSVSRC